MALDTFLTINDQSISLRQALGYLRTTGDLPRMIQVILRQYVIEQQIQSHPNLEIDPQRLEQAIINFRLQNQIVEPASFEQWLQSQRLNYSQFRHQFVSAIQLAQLKVEVTANKVEQFFNENKEQLDQVVLSRIVVDRQDLAEELMRQLTEDNRPFEELAKTHSIMGENLVNGMMGLVMMRQLPPPIRETIIGAEPGNILGPVKFEDHYSILRVEQWQPAELKGKLKQEIQDQIFEQWVQEQLKEKEIKLHLE